jgi:hypothetical protein
MRSMSHELRVPERTLDSRKACAPCLKKSEKKGNGPPPNINKNWTEVELSLLRELNEKFKDHKYPNIEISAILTSKSIDQIKYQRRKLKFYYYLSEVMSSQETVWETEGGCDLVDPGNASSEEHLQRPTMIMNFF